MAASTTKSAHDAAYVRRIMDANKHLDWFHKFEAVPGLGVMTPGNNDVGRWEGRMKFLENDGSMFKGKRVLDIGAYSGAFSFFLEEHGADVVALDVYDPDLCGFSIIKELRGSKIEHVRMSVYDVCPAALGYFDIVAYYGVFYHLKHPILSFERLRSVLRDDGLMIGGGSGSEEWFHDADPSCEKGVNLRKAGLSHIPLVGYVDQQFMRDVTSWFLPNEAALKGWLTNTGFIVEKMQTHTGPIIRDWNTKGLKRSSTTFKARKGTAPRKEYVSPAMLPYEIPTGWEVAQLRAELARLKDIIYRNRAKIVVEETR